MGDFSSGDIDAFLGIERVIQELGPVLDEHVGDWGAVRKLQEIGVDLPSRTAYALASLRLIREERQEASQARAEPAAVADETSADGSGLN